MVFSVFRSSNHASERTAVYDMLLTMPHITPRYINIPGLQGDLTVEDYVVFPDCGALKLR